MKAYEFFEKVKEKKITYTGWICYWDYYVISRNIHFLQITGELYNKGTLESENYVLSVGNGLDQSSGSHWKFVEEEKVTQSSRCTCPKDVILNIGCQCKAGQEELKKERNK